MQYLQIFLGSSCPLVRPLRSAKAPFVMVREEANTGLAVPPGGPLTRLLSVMMAMYAQKYPSRVSTIIVIQLGRRIIRRTEEFAYLPSTTYCQLAMRLDVH